MEPATSSLQQRDPLSGILFAKVQAPSSPVGNCQLSRSGNLNAYKCLCHEVILRPVYALCGLQERTPRTATNGQPVQI